MLQNEELKKEADTVLAEVTHRQSEGKRQIALLESLQKLHQARIQAIEARGSKLSIEESTTCQHSNSIIGKWKYNSFLEVFQQHFQY